MQLPKPDKQNLLTLLLFDPEMSPVIRASLPLSDFQSHVRGGDDVYGMLAAEAYDFMDKYGEPVGHHLDSVMYDVLGAEDERAALFLETIDSMWDLHKEGLNKAFVMQALRDFRRQRSLESRIMEAAEFTKRGELDKANEIMTRVDQDVISEVFDPGIMAFQDPVGKVISALADQASFIPTNIAPLNRIRIGPTAKELLLIAGPTGRGKSWALVFMGKYSLLARKRVLHVTLEMSAARSLSRYIQSLLSVGYEKGTARVATFNVNDVGRYSGLDFRKTSFRGMQEHRSWVVKRFKRLQSRFQLVVKEFPTGTLSVGGLTSYMDLLERHHGFVPDVLIVDYADLMDVDHTNLRIDLGRVYKALRAIATKRNIAVVTASQTNRAAEVAGRGGLHHLGEDYSKGATSDVVLILSQREAERLLGLARVYVAKNRNEGTGSEIAVAQGYSRGQFVLGGLYSNGDSTTGSVLISGRSGEYFSDVEANTNDREIESGRRRTRQKKGD